MSWVLTFDLMHYCQSCETQHLMEPGEATAVCPRCGHVEPTARRMPLFVVTGASGAGKTTVFEPLLAELAGRCAVFDVDWLIDPLTPRDGQVDWAAFRDTWLHVAHGVAQNGLPTMLLGPFMPDQLEGLAGRRWVDGVHFMTLDCTDVERRRRLEARPRWRSRDIEAQTEFGRWLRANLPSIDTSAQSPAVVAAAIAGWFDATAA